MNTLKPVGATAILMVLFTYYTLLVHSNSLVSAENDAPAKVNNQSQENDLTDLPRDYGRYAEDIFLAYSKSQKFTRIFSIMEQYSTKVNQLNLLGEGNVSANITLNNTQEYSDNKNSSKESNQTQEVSPPEMQSPILRDRTIRPNLFSRSISSPQSSPEKVIKSSENLQVHDIPTPKQNGSEHAPPEKGQTLNDSKTTQDRESLQVQLPSSDQPKSSPPSPDQPKSNPPSTDQPKSNPPSTDQPKSNPPSPDQPKSNPPSTDQQQINQKPHKSNSSVDESSVNSSSAPEATQKDRPAESEHTKAAPSDKKIFRNHREEVRGKEAKEVKREAMKEKVEEVESKGTEVRPEEATGAEGVAKVPGATKVPKATKEAGVDGVQGEEEELKGIEEGIEEEEEVVVEGVKEGVREEVKEMKEEIEEEMKEEVEEEEEMEEEVEGVLSSFDYTSLFTPSILISTISVIIISLTVQMLASNQNKPIKSDMRQSTSPPPTEDAVKIDKANQADRLKEMRLLERNRLLKRQLKLAPLRTAVNNLSRANLDDKIKEKKNLLSQYRLYETLSDTNQTLVGRVHMDRYTRFRRLKNMIDLKSIPDKLHDLEWSKIFTEARERIFEMNAEVEFYRDQMKLHSLLLDKFEETYLEFVARIQDEKTRHKKVRDERLKVKSSYHPTQEL